MSDVTQLLDAIGRGDPRAIDQLLPLVYDELRALAARRLSQEKPGQTLQATALVHGAYLRLVGNDPAAPASTGGSGSAGGHWNSRGHFFAAAAEAMRRILVERARGKATIKRGGTLRRVASPQSLLPCSQTFSYTSLTRGPAVTKPDDASSPWRISDRKDTTARRVSTPCQLCGAKILFLRPLCSPILTVILRVS